jgi:hypothetical protein
MTVPHDGIMHDLSADGACVSETTLDSAAPQATTPPAVFTAPRAALIKHRRRVGEGSAKHA